jgi:hypothetical protein
MKIAKLAVVALAALPAMIAATYASDAAACGMSYGLERPTIQQKPSPVQDIAAAEKSLENGDNAAAARRVLNQFANVRNVTAGQNPLETRALRVFALAVARSSGAVTERSSGVSTSTEWTPAANLEWAAQSLREIDAKRPNDPAVQADLGEALSKLPRTEGEALGILQGLADRDLMGSPFAYAALARLRSGKGDAAGAEAALRRCGEMTKTPGVCKPTAPVPAKPSAAPSVLAKA